jgi:hypothetical protein
MVPNIGSLAFSSTIFKTDGLPLRHSDPTLQGYHR